jgi:hypothetical protein
VSPARSPNHVSHIVLKSQKKPQLKDCPPTRNASGLTLRVTAKGKSPCLRDCSQLPSWYKLSQT